MTERRPPSDSPGGSGPAGGVDGLSRWAAVARRLHALARKDIAALGWLLWALGVGWLVTGYLARKAFYADPAAVSLLPAIGRSNAWFTPFAAMVLGRGLVVRDYRHRTQQFVEALPLRRVEAVAAKWALGLLWLFAVSATIVTLAYWDQGESSFELLLMLWIRSGGYVWAVWATSVLLGLLGRYRWLAYLLSILALIALTERGVEVSNTGPVALLTQDFGLERYDWPLHGLVLAGVWGAIAFGLSLGLATLREGSAAELLAKRASSQEKAGLLGLAAVLGLVVTTMDGGREHRPFEFHGSPLLVSDTDDIEVMVGQDELKARGQRLIGSLERLATRFQRDLPSVVWPPVRVAHNGQLSAPPFRLEQSGPVGGFLMEANLADEAWDDWGLSKVLIHDMIGARSKGRGLFEPNHWFADGFTAYWSSDALASPNDQFLATRHANEMWLSALAAARRLSLKASQWGAWERVMETVGEEAATALAFTLVQTFEDLYGRTDLLRLAKCILWQPTVSNGLQWAFSKRCDLPDALEATSGKPFEHLLAAYDQRAEEYRTQFLPLLEQVAHDTVRFTAQLGDAGGAVHYALSGAPLTRERQCEFRHGKLPAADQYVSGSSLKVEALTWPAAAGSFRGTMPGLYQSGQRVLLLMDCAEPLLDRNVRLGVARLELP